MNPVEKTVKLFYYFLYFFVTLTGIPGTLVFFFSKKKLTARDFIIAAYPWMVALTLVLYGIIGFRYYVSAYPVFVIFSSFLILSIINYFKKKNIEVT